MTEWRRIPGFERYEVSDDGRVRNASTGLVRKQRLSHRGYWNVAIPSGPPSRRKRGDGLARATESKVHRLVALAFVPNPDSKPFVNHIDCNQQNNHYSNLEWVTGVENQEHARQNGRYHAATNPNRVRKLSPALLAAIRARKAAGESLTVLAKECDVTPGSLLRALKGGRSQVGQTAGMARVRMSREVAGRIKGLFASGVHKSEVARRIGVTPAVAGRVINGKRWKDAPPIPPEADEAS